MYEITLESGHLNSYILYRKASKDLVIPYEIAKLFYVNGKLSTNPS